MKLLLCFLLLVSISYAQEPEAYLKQFDNKIYSLKTKGVKDFVVDIESSQISQNMKKEKIFGNVKELFFRVYWTSSPERVSVEVIGLPEGFKEIKDNLKMTVLGMMDYLIPEATDKRFEGYKFTKVNPRELHASDVTGIATIPRYILKFDGQDTLASVEGVKAVGTLIVTPAYEKTSFSGGKLVLKNQSTLNSEGGQSYTVQKDFKYGTADGISVLTEVSILTEQKLSEANTQSFSSRETLSFTNYKINTGEALKHFLSDTPVQKTE